MIPGAFATFWQIFSANPKERFQPPVLAEKQEANTGMNWTRFPKPRYLISRAVWVVIADSRGKY